MKILYIIPNLSGGGAERMILDICLELKNRKNVRVKLITLSDFNRYSYLSGKIDWEVINVSVSLSLFKKNKIDIKNLQNAIEEFAPDIIHSHLFIGELYSRFCYYPKAKWFSHCHDNMKQFKPLKLIDIFNKGKISNWYEKKLLFKGYQKNGGTKFIAISKHTQEFFLKTASPYKVTLLLNSINYDRFYFDRKPTKALKLNLINIGSLFDKKNQSFLINVAKYLQEKRLDFSLKFFGEGPNMDLLKIQIQKLDLSSQIELCGIVTNIEQQLANADMYVHSATYEPLGLVFIEAMASGLPVVCLDGKGNRDLIIQNKNGVLLNDNSVEVFSETILKIWENQDVYLQMSKFGQSFAKKFDIKIYIDQLLEIYKAQ